MSVTRKPGGEDEDEDEDDGRDPVTHSLSMLSVSHLVVCGTICNMHFDFSPYNGSVHPASLTTVAFFAKRTCFCVLLPDLFALIVHRDRKCSYRSLTSQ